MENRYAEARREAEAHPDFIDLIDTNFHSCGFRYPAAVLRRTARRYYASGGLSRYHPDPAGTSELRARVAGFYVRAGIPAQPGHVVITASASESYSHIFASRCSPGDRVLLPRPGYPLFEDVARRHALEIDFYDQQPDRGWRVDLSALEAQISTRTRSLVIISPNNPTGHVFSAADIAGAGALCRRHGLFLVVDEVFSEILFAGGGLPRPARLLTEQLVFTINGVSKLFASPDLKVSWILASGPAGARDEAVEALQIQNDLFLSAAPLSQRMAAELLSRGTAFSRALTREIAARRESALAALGNMTGLRVIPPAGGIHLPLLLDAPGSIPIDDEEVAVHLLRRCRVAVHPGYLYEMPVPALVMSYLSPADRLRAGLERLRDGLGTFAAAQ